MRRLGLALGLLAVLASAVWAFDPTAPTQHGTLLNSETVSAASGTAVATLTGVNFKQVHIYQIGARCNTTWASLTITNGGTTIFSSDTSFVSTNTKILSFTPVPLTGSVGATMVITLGPCAPGSIGTLDVQADVY
jgi:hypothetical protein